MYSKDKNTEFEAENEMGKFLREKNNWINWLSNIIQYIEKI